MRTCAALCSGISVPPSPWPGELVLMDAGSGSYFSFEEVGTQVWQALAAPVQVAAVCELLAAHYEAPIEQIQADVLAFLEDLLARGLIKVV